MGKTSRDGYSANAILYLPFAFGVTEDLVVGFLCWLIYPSILLLVRIPAEEKMLMEDKGTGEAYKKYMSRVRARLIPFVF